jgi:lipoate-protein ligase A
MRWRLIAYEEYDGATNMALDEAILAAHLKNLVPPTLRFYGFKPPCISIGHSQIIGSEVLAKARLFGFDLVRRPTGGRAVLHANELTYSLIGSTGIGSSGLSSSILEAYKQICLGLQLGMESLGLPLELGETKVPYKDLQDCFAATTGSDLHYQGKKMIGSAQLRRKQAVLQHGSILLNQDQKLLPKIFGHAESEVIRHANLYEVLGKEISLEELTSCLSQGFAQAFDCQFVLGKFTEEEKTTARQLGEYYQWK